MPISNFMYHAEQNKHSNLQAASGWNNPHMIRSIVSDVFGVLFFIISITLIVIFIAYMNGGCPY
jgi:hypothetical protein